MTTVEKDLGFFSIFSKTLSSKTGNVYKETITGKGAGNTGNQFFQTMILKQIETIIRNSTDVNYTIETPAVDVGSSETLYLFYVPSNVTQTLPASEANLREFILKNDSLTLATTTTITDVKIVKIATYIASQIFNTVKAAAELINDTEENTEECLTSSNGRLQKCISNCIFDLAITIQ